MPCCCCGLEVCCCVDADDAAAEAFGILHILSALRSYIGFVAQKQHAAEDGT
jgi:hypothetical protein